MMRVLIIFLLSGIAAVGQTAPTPSAPAAPSPTTELAPEAAVITIHGVCPAGKDGRPSSCITTISKDQFETIVSAMTFNTPGQALTAAAMRNIAENYVHLLTLADAAEQAGLDRDARFQELMKIVRLRILGDVYRHSLEEKYSHPSAEEIEAEYKRVPGRFDQVGLDRILIPRFNPKSPRQNRAEFEKKAAELAARIRDRAAKGEDMGKLQMEAYKTLELTPPLTTDVGLRRTTALPASVKDEVSALKAGEVSKVGSEAAGFTIYKVRSRETLPLEQVKAEIVREIYEKKMDAELKAIEGRARADYEELFFGPKGPPIAPAPPKPVRTP